jgi:RIO kinase 2
LQLLKETMKLDVTCMRFLSKDDFRVLTAIEMGMRNHELVPIELIPRIAKLRHGGAQKILSTLLRYKLVAHTNTEYDGYRLSYLGYDILALNALLTRGVISFVGSQIGVGKESDIFEARNEEGEDVVIKIHRLGRTSFRAVRRTRSYMEGKGKASWLYMSRLAAIREYAYMKALYERDFPVPQPIDQSRHIVVMSKVDGFPLSQLRSGQLEEPNRVFRSCLAILRKLAEYGLIHCDFNEFNLMIDSNCGITLIDFPQMVSTSHVNALSFFERDMNCLVKFFAMKMKYIPSEDEVLSLPDILAAGMPSGQEVRLLASEEQLEGMDIDPEALELDAAIGGSAEEMDDDEDEDEDDEDEVVGNEGEEEEQLLASNLSTRNGEEASKVFVFGKETITSELGQPASNITNTTTTVQREEESSGEEEDRPVIAHDKITEKVRRTIEKSRNNKGSKVRGNSTKKRNKYGKIVRTDLSY